MSDVAVVGAGFAGLALASVCADAGLSVEVHERRPALAPEGVGVLLQPNGLAAVDRLGVLDEVLAAGQRIETAHLCDPDGRVRGIAGYAELRHPHPYLVLVERASLIDILAARLPASVDLRFESGAEAAFGRLVVGADGVASAVRASMGVRSRLRFGPHRYLIGIADVPPPVEQVTLYCGRGWCDGVLPLRGRTYFFHHLGDEGEDWSEAFAGRVPHGAEIAASVRTVGVLSGRTHVASPRAQPGRVMIGDAAAAVHPHNGQGANRALEDAVQLGELLAEHGPLAHDRIAAWARRRDRRSRLQVAWSIWIGRTFDGPHIGWRANRELGWRAARIPALNRMTTRWQAGL